MKMEITRTLKTLPERQRETLCCFFGIGVEQSMTLEDIARKFDLTTERVSVFPDNRVLIQAGSLTLPHAYHLPAWQTNAAFAHKKISAVCRGG